MTSIMALEVTKRGDAMYVLYREAARDDLGALAARAANALAW